MPGSWGEAGAPPILLSKGSSFYFSVSPVIQWGPSLFRLLHNVIDWVVYKQKKIFLIEKCISGGWEVQDQSAGRSTVW